jgi:protein O-mannosyl-transferase
MAKKDKQNKPVAPQQAAPAKAAPKPQPKAATAQVDLLDVNFEPEGVASDSSSSSGIWGMLTKGIIPYIIITALGLVCYISTFNHELALDDDIVICKNEFVLRGAKGIPDIFTHDLFESFYRQMNTKAQLSGGRYRPFSVATFAIEQEFIGLANTRRFKSTCWDENKNGNKDLQIEDKNRDGTIDDKDCYAIPPFDALDCWDYNANGKQDPEEDITKDGFWNDRDCRNKGMAFRHVNNVIMYILSIGVLFMFVSSFIFKNNKLLALIISLMFLAHPIHTEVVANVKSRDEILSLMFMILSLHNAFRYYDNKKMSSLIMSAICFFTAMMSKEYGVTLLAITPIALIGYHKRIDVKQLAPIILALGITFAIYYLCRSSVVMTGKSDLQGGELLNNPYKLATDEELWPSKLFVNIKYLWLLLVPHPLSCDYSYNVIPYRTFADLGVLASLILLIGSGIALARTTLKKSWLAFPIAFALLHLLLVNNVIFDIGASMGERLVYHSSFGTVMLLCVGVWYLFKKFLPAQSSLYALPLLAIIGVYTVLTMKRAPVWKNDITLHLTDVQTYPNSTMLNGNACTRLIELSEMPKNKAIMNRLLDSAKIYGKKSLELHPEFVNSFLNMGIVYMKQGNTDSARFYWSGVERYYPSHPQLPMIRAALSGKNVSNAQEAAKKGDPKAALAELMKAHALDPNNLNLMRDIANYNYSLGNFQESRRFAEKLLRLSPTDTQMIKLRAYYDQQGIK